MTYPTPTVTQLVIIAVALIAPPVWAFTHHGGTRKTMLLLWGPLFLFVTRVVYLNPSPTAPLESRVDWAFYDLGMDPLTILWPVFVLLIYFLIWLFTAPRRRREARSVVAAQRQLPAPQAAAPTVPAQSSVAATGHWPPAPQPRYTACRHCGTAVTSPTARYCAGCGTKLGYDPTQRSQEV